MTISVSHELRKELVVPHEPRLACPRAILTDVDGTLVEPAGGMCLEAWAALDDAHQAGVPVVLLSSKTRCELALLARELPGVTACVYENGAGLMTPDGRVLARHARTRASEELRHAFRAVRAQVGAPAVSIDELDDSELARATAQFGRALEAVRVREHSVAIVVERGWDASLRAALGELPLRLVRTNRFLLLHGAHDKADARADIVGMLACDGEWAALGDSADDLSILSAAPTAIIVPTTQGPHPALVSALPKAMIAPAPHGLGWARAVRTLLRLA